MSDSAKLRFVYGLISYILSFFVMAAILVLSLLIGFKIIPTNFLLIIFFLIASLVVLFVNALINFMKLYDIGKKEH